MMLDKREANLILIFLTARGTRTNKTTKACKDKRWIQTTGNKDTGVQQFKILNSFNLFSCDIDISYSLRGV